MRQSRFRFPETVLPTLAMRPSCPCGMQMWLSRVMPAEEPNWELRIFECPVCNHAEHVIVKPPSLAER
jgi:hypothetical protein